MEVFPGAPLPDALSHCVTPRLEAPECGYSSCDKPRADVRHNIFDVAGVSDSEKRLGRALLVRGKRLNHLVEHGRIFAQAAGDEALSHFHGGFVAIFAPFVAIQPTL